MKRERKHGIDNSRKFWWGLVLILSSMFVSSAMCIFFVASCNTNMEKCQTKEKQEEIASRRVFFNDAMRFYFPSNNEDIARGRFFIEAMENGTLTNDNEFINCNVCLLVRTIPYNPEFIVYPISDLAEGNYWGILGEHTNIQINVISTSGSDLRPMTASGWGSALLGTIIKYSEKDKKVSLLVEPKNCIITEK